MDHVISDKSKKARLLPLDKAQTIKDYETQLDEQLSKAKNYEHNLKR
jgi:hypothetical protein